MFFAISLIIVKVVTIFILSCDNTFELHKIYIRITVKINLINSIFYFVNKKVKQMDLYKLKN